MRKIRLALIAAALTATLGARAQYYELANQLTNMISPALSGSLNYKGTVELSGTAGAGYNRSNFVGASTSQGFMYADWFFMGAGLGIDAVIAPEPEGLRPDMAYGTTRTKAMLPIFSDFRFIIGGLSATGAYIDLKLGAAWMLGNDYLCLQDRYVGSGALFYLKPSVGVRVPTGSSGRQAVNIGITYQLLTSGNSYYPQAYGVTLNSIGASIAYEW